jgi:hypothetical protein
MANWRNACFSCPWSSTLVVRVHSAASAMAVWAVQRCRWRLCLVVIFDVGALRSDEPNVLVGGDRPNEGARRLNHASADMRTVLARAAARGG